MRVKEQAALIRSNMTTKSRKLAFVDLPHDATAIRAGQHRAATELIHFVHAASSRSRHLDLVLSGDAVDLVRPELRFYWPSPLPE